MSYDFMKAKLTSHFAVNHKFNKRNIIKFGFNAEGMFMSQKDSIRTSYISTAPFKNRWDYSASACSTICSIQTESKQQHGLYRRNSQSIFFLSNSISIAEPRVGGKYRF